LFEEDKLDDYLVLRFFRAVEHEVFDDYEYILCKNPAEAKKRAREAFNHTLKEVLYEKSNFLSEKYMCSYCDTKLKGRAEIYITKLTVVKEPPKDVERDMKKLVAKGIGFKMACQIRCPGCGREKVFTTGYFHY